MYWDTQRKIVYALAMIAFLLAIAATGAYIFRDSFLPHPTCMDGKQNGYELGVDCGGTCALMCIQDVQPLTVSWAKAVRSGNRVYDLVAMVVNTNINNASQQTGYTFTLYNNQGQVSDTYSGSLTVPIDSKFPIILQNIPLATAPANVVVTLTDGSHYKVFESPTVPIIRVLKQRYEAGQTPRVYSTLMNTRRVEISNLPVKVILFDRAGNAYAVGQTVVPMLTKEAVKEVIFTWESPLPFAPEKIGIYPIFNPFDSVGY